MNFHTLSPKLVLILGALLFPIGLGSNVSFFLSLAVKKRSLANQNLGMILSYFFIAFLLHFTEYVKPFYFLWDCPWYFIILAILMGALTLPLEYGIGVIIERIITGKWVQGFQVHAVYSESNKLDGKDYLSVFLFVLAEEILFRNALIPFLDVLGMGRVWILFFASLVFVFNHVQFGWKTMLQKFASGLIYVGLFVYSGYCVFVPVIAHMCQNYLLLALSQRRSHDG